MSEIPSIEVKLLETKSECKVTDFQMNRLNKKEE